MASIVLCQFLLGILLVSLFPSVFPNDDDGCPKIHVTKNRILRTKEALDNGAKFLQRSSVDSARDCYKLCCEHSTCNLAMLSYKNATFGSGTKRICYLFNCGSPTRCSYSPYNHYATIEFEDRKPKSSFESESNIQKTRTKVTTKSGDDFDEDCPAGVPVAMCSSNPCTQATCPAHPWSVCKPSFCRTCHAKFYDDDGIRVNCHGDSAISNPIVKTSHHSKSDLNSWLDNIWKQNEKPHKAVQQKSGKQKPSSHKASSHIQSYKDKLKETTRGGFSPNHMGSGSSRIRNQKPLLTPTTAEPFHHWREFIDNNPKFGKVKKVTEKPTEHKKPEIVHNKHTQHLEPKTQPTLTHKPKPTYKPTTLPAKPYLTPEGRPTKDGKSAPHNLPKPNDKPQIRNVSDVVIIETSHLRIIENKAVLPLAIFLVIAILLLFIVALRLRLVKSRLRRKAFATDDADYLINGMYL